jgi:hypothetical protein
VIKNTITIKFLSPGFPSNAPAGDRSFRPASIEPSDLWLSPGRMLLRNYENREGLMVRDGLRINMMIRPAAPPISIDVAPQMPRLKKPNLARTPPDLPGPIPAKAGAVQLLPGLSEECTIPGEDLYPDRFVPGGRPDSRDSPAILQKYRRLIKIHNETHLWQAKMSVITGNLHDASPGSGPVRDMAAIRHIPHEKTAAAGGKTAATGGDLARAAVPTPFNDGHQWRVQPSPGSEVTAPFIPVYSARGADTNSSIQAAFPEMTVHTRPSMRDQPAEISALSRQEPAESEMIRPAPQALDLNRISDQVCSIIERRLKIERERRGYG